MPMGPLNYAEACECRMAALHGVIAITWRALRVNLVAKPLAELHPGRTW